MVGIGHGHQVQIFEESNWFYDKSTCIAGKNGSIIWCSSALIDLPLRFKKMLKHFKQKL